MSLTKVLGNAHVRKSSLCYSHVKITNQHTSYGQSPHDLVKTVVMTCSVLFLVIKSSIPGRESLPNTKKLPRTSLRSSKEKKHSSLLPESQVQMIRLSTRLVGDLIVRINRSTRHGRSLAPPHILDPLASFIGLLRLPAAHVHAVAEHIAHGSGSFLEATSNSLESVTHVLGHLESTLRGASVG